MSKQLTIVDLFCGAGIGAIGFQQAGFKILYANDIEQYAVDTYNNNIGNHAVCNDIRDININDIPNTDVIIAGVPCNSFSFAGKNEGITDKQYGDLFEQFNRIVKGKMPKAFMFENVKGLLSKKHKPIFNHLLIFLTNIGYDITWKLTNSIEYGIPQKRERVFVVGIRKDLNLKYEFPTPTNITNTIRDTIGNMPEPNEPNDYYNHYGLGIRKDELPFIHKVPIGGNWKDIPIEDQKLFLGNAYYSEGGRTGFLRKVSFDKPSLTITATIDGKFNAQIVDLRDKYNDNNKIGCRRFTVRECLRLQTVPDWFYFDDNISIRKQYDRTGGGIPTNLAYLFSKRLYDILTGDYKSTNLFI